MSRQSKDAIRVKPIIFRLEHDNYVKDRVSVRIFIFRDDQINHLRWCQLGCNHLLYRGTNFARGSAGYTRHVAPYVIVCSSSMYLLLMMLGHP